VVDLYVNKRGGIARDIKRIRALVQRFQGRRDILSLSDFERNDLKANRVGRCLNILHLQHAGGTTHID
jgi:hypothetical protein